MKKIDVDNLNLQILECDNNPLTSLKLGNNSTLKHLEAEGTQLKTLDISGCPNLRRLYVDGGVEIIREKIDGEFYNGTVGQEYSSTVYFKGTAHPCEWIGTVGKLPTGLTFKYEHDTATLSGKPTKAGKFSFNLIVSDAEGFIILRKFTVKITAATTAASKTSSESTSGAVNIEKDKSEELQIQTKKTTSSAPAEENITKNLNVMPKAEKISSDSNSNVQNSIKADEKSKEKIEGHGINLTVLNVINEDKLAQGTGKDEDLITVRADTLVKFFIEKWVMPNGTKADIQAGDIVIYVDEKPVKNIKISEAGIFTLPLELVKGDFKIQAKAKSNQTELETTELFISAE